jgi:hypothetical protein
LISQIPALFFALAGMLLWIFFSPHRNFEGAVALFCRAQLAPFSELDI